MIVKELGHRRCDALERLRRQAFDHLSAEERAIVGDTADYDWDNAVRVPAKRKSPTTQFSLRLEKALSEALELVANERGLTFSDVVRDAIGQYVGESRRPDLPTNVYEITGAGISLMSVSQGFVGLSAHWSASKAVQTNERATVGSLVEQASVA